MKNYKKLFILTCASLLCTAMLNGCKAAPENETSAGTQAESQIQPATEKLTNTGSNRNPETDGNHKTNGNIYGSAGHRAWFRQRF